MMEILKLFDHTTNTWKSVPAIKGEDGISGVYYGTDTPPANSGATVWVNPNGTVNLFNMIYPVGSIYMSVNNTSPATLFGGTWVQIKDTFLLSAGDTYTAGDTGGEATHTLIKAELPAEQYTVMYGTNQYVNWGGNKAGSAAGGINVGASSQYTLHTPNLGSGDAHNNMPPYLVVYVWQRTA